MIVQTDRLILRHFTIEDLEALVYLLADPRVMRFSASGPLSKLETTKLLQDCILRQYQEIGFSLYAVIHREDQCFIGGAGLLPQLIDGTQEIRLSYRLNPGYWGQGLATEAAMAVCHFAFEDLGLKELVSVINPLNQPSVNVAKRIGMKFWKETLHEHTPVEIHTLSRYGFSLPECYLQQSYDEPQLLPGEYQNWQHALAYC